MQDRLDDLLSTLPKEVIEKTAKEKLMEFAIEKVGDDFINLGKAGREYVINDLLKKLGEVVPVESIQEAVSTLEHQVSSLAEINDVQELQVQLKTLPLSNYRLLSSERKQMIAEQLIESNQWKGLASLDRLIHQQDAKLSAAEEQDIVEGMESGIATALDFNRLEGLAVQIR